jgi:hypothetical protein
VLFFLLRIIERVSQDLLDGQDFFAFPEERQKVSSLLRADFIYPRKRDCLSLFHPERVKAINPKNPVDPVKYIFFQPLNDF